MKLHARAVVLLKLIADRTRRDADGSLSCFWVPPFGPVSYTLDGNVSSTYVGGGDGARLRSLERKGLIERPEGTPATWSYAYAITDKGLEVLEHRRGE